MSLMREYPGGRRWGKWSGGYPACESRLTTALSVEPSLCDASGPRLCLGMNLANYETLAFLAATLPKYDFQWATNERVASDVCKQCDTSNEGRVSVQRDPEIVGAGKHSIPARHFVFLPLTTLRLLLVPSLTVFTMCSSHCHALYRSSAFCAC
jgi:hypothetical protein